MDRDRIGAIRNPLLGLEAYPYTLGKYTRVQGTCFSKSHDYVLRPVSLTQATVPTIMSVLVTLLKLRAVLR